MRCFVGPADILSIELRFLRPTLHKIGNIRDVLREATGSRIDSITCRPAAKICR